MFTFLLNKISFSFKIKLNSHLYSCDHIMSTYPSNNIKFISMVNTKQIINQILQLDIGINYWMSFYQCFVIYTPQENINKDKSCPSES